MSRDDEQCLKLGREVVRMIGELRGVAQSEAGYTSRKFTFPLSADRRQVGEVTMFLVNTEELAATFEAAAEQKHNVLSVQISSPSSGAN